MWLSEKQKSYIHFLISLCIEKAARNRWTQHLIFWTKKSMKICWVLDHHHHKKNLSTYLQTFIKVSANHDPTFVESMMAMQSSSFFFWAKSIKRVCVVGREDKWLWKTTKTLTSVHIYMTLQNYCKWSGIYFCHAVCFEKTHHIAALRFRWWLDYHDSDDFVHKWWWWLQIVLFLDMDVELGDLFLMASRPGMEELLQSVKAW